MCLVVFNWRPETAFPLLLVANRDEFRARPTQPVHWWKAPELLAGKDLKAGGTWFAIDRQGRFALITNIRPGYVGTTAELSRGELPLAFIKSAQSIPDFHSSLKPEISRYGGFNLLLGEPDRLFWFSSDYPEGQWVAPGIHVLSNDALDTPWPKAELARQQMTERLARLEQRGEISVEGVGILENVDQFSDNQLPSTGVPLEWERHLSAQNIKGEEYGTRSRIWLRTHEKGDIWVDEAQLDTQGIQHSLASFHWSTSAF